MRVLVACERSGVVRDAFAALGHDAVSCDLVPSATPGPHRQGDVRDILGERWDLMIAHPPCTRLAVSGAHLFARYRAEQEEALEFVRLLMAAPIPRIAIENPVSVISSRIRKPDQIIQPYQFGEDASKATCLWLQGLPRLHPTRYVEPGRYRCRCGCVFPGALGKYGCPSCAGADDASPSRPLWANQTDSGQNRVPGGKRQAMIRAATYPGIAGAMAAQWSGA